MSAHMCIVPSSSCEVSQTWKQGFHLCEKSYTINLRLRTYKMANNTSLLPVSQCLQPICTVKRDAWLASKYPARWTAL